MNVRQLILGDMSQGLIEGKGKPSWGVMKQRIGRALRLCSHKNLPEKERKLNVTLYVATAQDLKSGQAIETQDMKKLNEVRAQQLEVETAMCAMEKDSIDSTLYGKSDCN